VVRHDGLSSIQEGLDLAKVFLQQEAESAFLKMGLAADPYEPQVNIANGFEKVLALFGANRCLSIHADVLMEGGGTTEMQYLTVGDPVMAYDKVLDMFVPSRVEEIFHNDPGIVCRFEHSEGFLECTRSHKVCVVYPTGRISMVRVMRAVKDGLPVRVMDKNGLPKWSEIRYAGWSNFEPTMDIRISHPDHAFVANDTVVSNSGKSHLGAYKMAWDATGLYPDWYKGPRTVRGIDAWILGKTAEITRDSCQKKLFGPDPERPGWTDKPSINGLIPNKYIMGRPSRKSAPTGCFDTVRVKHVPSDTTSTLTFKAYEMERQSLAAWNGDRVWVDEECPMDIIEEIIARLMDSRGQMIITLCPLDGMTPTVKFLKTAPADLVRCDTLKHTHAKHLAQEEKDNIKRMYAHNPAMLLARTEGEATMNSGLIFPFPTQSILYDPSKISISSRWKYLSGMDVGWKHPTAAAALALDPLSDIVYCYATYDQPERPPLYHHAQLNAWGENMSFMIDPASNQTSQINGEKILEQYWILAHGKNYLNIPEEKRKYIKANNTFDIGMPAMWDRFNTGRLLFSKNLQKLISQYDSYVWDKDGKGPRVETEAMPYDIITSVRYGSVSINEYAHRLDDIAPWQEGDGFEDEIRVDDWKPFRAGGGHDVY